MREAREETGLQVELIDTSELQLTYPHNNSFPRPHLCMIVDAVSETEPLHQHIDFLYLGRPVGGQLTVNITESHDVRWFTRAEVESLRDEEILPDVREILLDTMKEEVLV